MRTDSLVQRVADEARPPAVLGRYPGPEIFLQALLDDLVASNAWLDRELKEPFLALWVNEPEFDDPDLDDHIEELDYNNVHAIEGVPPASGSAPVSPHLTVKRLTVKRLRKRARRMTMIRGMKVMAMMRMIRRLGV